MRFISQSYPIDKEYLIQSLKDFESDILSKIYLKNDESEFIVRLADPSNVNIINFDEAAKITWTDPDDIIEDGEKPVTWQGTVVVRKEGSAPKNWTDGILIERIEEKNKYKDTPLINENLINGIEYFYGIFPYSSQKIYNYNFTQLFIATEIYPDPPTIISAKGTNGIITLNIECEEGSLLKLVYKSGSAPESDSDGKIIDNLSPGIVNICDLTNSTEYFFVAYAYIKSRISPASNTISAIPKTYTLLGFKINKLESGPYPRVEYTEDAIGLTPAKVDLETGEFDYGSFADFWFVKNNKIVMLDYNGQEVYELNPNDYSKKIDGSDSDIENTSFEGNVMSKIPKVYLKTWEEDDYECCNICDVKIDNDYYAYAHTRADGSEMDYVYYSGFEGSLVGGKMRSLKGLLPTVQQDKATQKKYVNANGAMYSMQSWSQYNLINMLLILMGKTTDIQEAFGYGICTGSSVSSLKKTGDTYNKGQFYGRNQNINYMKVFHIENWYGNTSRRIEGCVTNANNQVLIKSTPPYNVTSEYENTGIVLSGTSGGYISSCVMTQYGLIPKKSSGSSSTYYTDQLHYMKSATSAIVGGDCSWGKGVGAFALKLRNSDQTWCCGTTISCEQPPETEQETPID